MNLLKCKNGAMLIHDVSTDTYWVVTEICGRPARLFAGGTYEKGCNTFNYYAKGEQS